MNAREIVGLLRTNRDADRLINEDAAALNARIVQRSSHASRRTEIRSYLVELYTEVAQLLSREVMLRTRAGMEAATARSHWHSLRLVLAAVSQGTELSPKLRTLVDDALRDHPRPTIPEDDQDEPTSTPPTTTAHQG